MQTDTKIETLYLDVNPHDAGWNASAIFNENFKYRISLARSMNDFENSYSYGDLRDYLEELCGEENVNWFTEYANRFEMVNDIFRGNGAYLTDLSWLITLKLERPSDHYLVRFFNKLAIIETRK